VYKGQNYKPGIKSYTDSPCHIALIYYLHLHD